MLLDSCSVRYLEKCIVITTEGVRDGEFPKITGSSGVDFSSVYRGEKILNQLEFDLLTCLFFFLGGGGWGG